MKAPRYDAGGLGRLLSRPFGSEELSPIEGPGVVVLDLEATSESDAELWRGALLEQLPGLPCVTIAVEASGASELSNPSESKRSLSSTCDVVLSESADLDDFLADFAKTPIAALAFVQLLRTATSLPIQGGLAAESFVYSTLQSGSEFKAWLAARAKPVRAERKAATRASRTTRAAAAATFAAGESPCRLERVGQRLTITLCRPDKHNAFSRAMRDALVEGLQLALADSSIDEVVICGEGESFCSGGDLDEFGTATDPAIAHVIRTTRSPAFLISRLAGRIRFQVHGACLGAGAELPAFSDRVIAHEHAFFQLPEIALGLIPGAGGTVSLPRRIGRQRTAWLGLSGRRIDARTALSWGLVDEVRLGQHVDGRGSIDSN